jgi:2-oxoisovalerate dehydrogenase E1 component
VTYADELVEFGVAVRDRINEIFELSEALILKAYTKATDLEISPRADLKSVGCLAEQVMLSNQRVEKLAEGTPEVLISKAVNPRIQQLAKRSRSAFDECGQRLPKNRCVGIRDALFEAILDRFYVDPTLVAYGEENRDWGGAFAVYRGLSEALPYHRLFNTPISEGAIVGTAVGYALEGGRALVELMYCDFMGRAGDEIFNQLAKWQAMSGGLLRMPVVLRVSVGSKYGAQHSQDWSSMCAHIPGLKVVFPATPYDAKGLMYSALVGTDPVIFFESQRIYDMPEEFVPGGVPAGYFEVPIGEPDVKKQGKDLTILTIGATLYRTLLAASELEQKHGVECEIIDARSLVPFNYQKVIESVKKTRKILLTSDACERGSFLHTMASQIALLAFDELDAPPVVVGARNWITPADEVEDAFFPFPEDMLDAVHEHILPLRGYKVHRACDRAELMRRSSLGI